jgi:hypothetical protein
MADFLEDKAGQARQVVADAQRGAAGIVSALAAAGGQFEIVLREGGPD